MTHLAWKITIIPCSLMSGTGIQKRIILKFRDGTRKFTWKGLEIPYIGRYGGLIWQNQV
jgi:hypothetical protein